MQTLRQFIDSHEPKRTHEQWAADLGISRSHFTGIVAGARYPGREVIAAIAKLTDGRVPPQVWYGDASAGPPLHQESVGAVP